MEDQLPFRRRSLDLLDPRLFPTRESVVDFLRGDHFVVLCTAISCAFDTEDLDLPDQTVSDLRSAALSALDDIELLVADAVEAKNVIFDRGHRDVFDSPSGERIQRLCYLQLVGHASDMTLRNVLAEFVQGQIKSLQSDHLAGEAPSGATEQPATESTPQEPRLDVARQLHERVSDRLHLIATMAEVDCDDEISSVACDTINLVASLADCIGTEPSSWDYESQLEPRTRRRQFLEGSCAEQPASSERRAAHRSA